MRFCILTGWIAAVCLFQPYAATNAQEIESDFAPIQAFLMKGRLADGEAAMKAAVQENPGNQQARFSLGIVQFLRAIERLGQDHYRYGLLAGRTRSLPFLRLPIAENPIPEQISYNDARAILQEFVDGLKRAEGSLAGVDPESARVSLNIGTIRLDLDANGKLTDEESLWHITQALQNPRRSFEAAPPKDFPVVFDAGDVPWLQGYCHALSAVAEVILAYDWQDQFERTAHLFYPNVDTPYTFLLDEGPGPFMSFGPQNILDAIAWVHTINYQVSEPERMGKALMHIETVIRLSRESWRLISAEDDDEFEWIPNPRQTSLLKGLNVGRDLVGAWHEFLDELEAIVQGRKLVPFWRGIKGGVPINTSTFPRNPDVGINVRRIFTEPGRIDLALWIQGTGLAPYLEKGEITSPAKWNKMMRSFNGRFANFAFWFN